MPPMKEMEKEASKPVTGLFKRLPSEIPIPKTPQEIAQQTVKGMPVLPQIEQETQKEAAKTVTVSTQQEETARTYNYGAGEVLHSSNVYQPENLFSIAESIKKLTYQSDKKITRWIRHNSKEMTRITESVDGLLYTIKGNYDLGDAGSNLDFILKHFQEVVSSCDDYIGSHSPKTKEGKLRLDLVVKMRNEAAKQKDSFRDKLLYLMHHYDGDKSRIAQITPWQIYTLTRTASYSNDTPGVQINTKGGGTSIVYEVKSSDRTVYFKQSETTPDAELSTPMLKSKLQQYYQAIAKKMSSPDYEEGTLESHTDHVQQELLEHLLQKELPLSFENYILSELSPYKTPDDLLDAIGFPISAYPELRAFGKNKKGVDSQAIFSLFNDLHKYATATDKSAKTALIRSGSEMSCRNVATTRLADLLGISDIVARSEMADVSLNGNEMHGIIMEEAKGISMKDLMSEHEGKILHYSPLAMKQLSTLQLFDYLCGQVDRHAGNYKVYYKIEGNDITITGIKAFDNDLSFGQISYDRGLKFPVGEMQCPERLDENDRMVTTIAGIDAEFAKKIEALSPEDLKFFLSDILSEQEINSAIDRLSGLKACLARIANEDPKNKTGVLIEDDAAWIELANKSEKLSDAEKRALGRTNYIGFSYIGHPLEHMPEPR